MNKLIIFDCDGTLIESETIACNVFPKYWATHGIHFTEEEFKEKFIGTGEDAPINKEIFSKMPAYAREEGDRLLNAAIKESLKPVSGMKELLNSLDGKVCVASNSSLNYVRTALEITGLSRYFNSNIFSAEQVKRPKPEPDLFCHVASTLKYDLVDCIVVEDSPSGVKAAQNANIKVIGFSGAEHFSESLRNKLNKTNPSWNCTSINELSTLLKQIT